MAKKILIISGSPKKDGNTETLIKWFREGAELSGAVIEQARISSLKIRSSGCMSCRQCQKNKEYGCVVKDDISGLLLKMIDADVIVMGTPLYFFSASAQIKILIDRMFSLFKWDNKAGTMEAALKGKALVLLASAFEDVGLKDLEIPFKLTADYTSMKFSSLLVPDAGESGEIVKLQGVREKAVELGRLTASA